jgi:hypothetical protein
MFRSPDHIDVLRRDSLTRDMDSAQLSTPQNSQPRPRSATSSETTSPALSLFSKGHTARSGSTASSVASSPALRDSFEVFGSSKRPLTDVKEEPHEREDVDMTDAPGNAPGTSLPLAFLSAPYLHTSVSDHRSTPSQTPSDPSTLNLPSAAHYSFYENDTTGVHFSPSSSTKKRRSGDSPIASVTSRIGTRFPSFSRKWKSKTGASPKLSIITHSDQIRSRTNSASSQLISPALSAISKHESQLCSSPVQMTPEEDLTEGAPGPVDIRRADATVEEDQGQATTPLLPPIMAEFFSNVPLQSPLQSPTVAEAPSLPSSATPSSTPQLPCLPSPPLSTKPSIASIRQRSRAGTVVGPSDNPPLQIVGECDDDEWSEKLGHANFTIYPEPYLPAFFDLQSFKQLREDWDHARNNYAKHLTRTGEHYGTTSKTYILTEDKWSSVDAEWKKNNAALSSVLGPLVARSSGGDADASDSMSSSTVLEKPPTKVIIPKINDPSGKFPDMGDEDIVGPMAVGPARARTMQQLIEPTVQNRLSKKRNFFKFLSDMLGRSSGPGLRT